MLLKNFIKNHWINVDSFIKRIKKSHDNVSHHVSPVSHHVSHVSQTDSTCILDNTDSTCSADSNDSNVSTDSNVSVKKVCINNTKKKKILIADDSSVNRHVLKKILHIIPNYNLEIYEATNGLEVIEINKKHKFDIIFMDIKMPIQDGITASKEIIKYNSKMVIIGITGVDTSEKITKKCGMKNVLFKPIQLDKLSLIVNKYIEKEYYTIMV
jgi:CheY-like chemotaxis protein